MSFFLALSRLAWGISRDDVQFKRCKQDAIRRMTTIKGTTR
jgi:hypothetical protein